MSHPAPYPVRLADEITRQLGQLADHLSQLPPPQAAQVIARVLDLDEHQDTLKHVGTQPATTAAKPPAPAPLVVRRRR
ncbi:hypothetical protein [Streptomyces sp. NPDC057199]|uniref:hypothetical protein n=1 Tax=Streptomyces sp. NPDC057199 TaxID=3346047 RepID=UPI0036382B93